MLEDDKEEIIAEVCVHACGCHMLKISFTIFVEEFSVSSV